ncbi:MAG: class I SAM-dependent methyltransferase [Vicinamibacteria bacterium]|nr:class I SAM-dependent methyltransferase [Vicinamibacteria bacterium]
MPASDPAADLPEPASFRDPSGHVFWREGVVHRRVEARYASHYDRLMGSGLYEKLVAGGQLVAHEEVSLGLADQGAYRVLRPQALAFISYPYEWCAGQLRAAALLTLDVMRTALDHGLVLKDASAYNVQFVGSRPVLVDTLSFEAYEEGRPWVAYRQFCEHFLAPLALACAGDPRALGLLRAHIDGVPLPLASALLPGTTWLRFGLLTHVHLHARAQARLGDETKAATRATLSKHSLLALIDSLRRTIDVLLRPTRPSDWSDYEATCSYSAESRRQKTDVVRRFLEAAGAKLVLDLGANTGAFSRLAAEAGAFVVSIDGDPEVVAANFKHLGAARDERILPLVMDLSNPSPGLGWDGRERKSLADRGPADALLALALVHHLALGNNVPLPMVAAWLARLAPRALVEFVPKEDPQSQRLLAVREDVFDRYDRGHMEEALAKHFTIESATQLSGSGRVLYICGPRS